MRENDIVIGKIWGGLGNQMFQYACAKAYAVKNKMELKLDISSFNEINPNETPRSFKLSSFPNLHETIATKTEVSLLIKKFDSMFLNKAYRFLNGRLNFNPSHKIEPYNSFITLPPIPESIYLDGYWQSEKYFEESKTLIGEVFNLSHLLNLSYIGKIAQEINNTNSTSIHVRRGDYVTSGTANAHHGICSLDYYKSATIEISKSIVNSVFFIFSDDLDWCRKNLEIPFEHFYVSTEQDSHDMFLMSLCKNNIIANSSFSWWAAWLNRNVSKKVIAPKKWFNETVNKDLLLDNWTQL